ncbi:uncharacterized protein LOC135072167 [Ostrinia nubilalis]|uniref:uncharacterized protein LOC135072167 n=1 Tax=Ostrinia nubilalis TaxID=29057 RepID=UPI00308262B7
MISIKNNTLYNGLLESVECIQKSFAQLILLLLATVVPHFIFVAYSCIVHALADKKGFTAAQLVSLYRLVLFGAEHVVIAWSGQKVSNEGLKLKRVLAQAITRTGLYSQKSLLNFQHLVSAKPLKIELLPMVPVGMYLVPAVLSLTVNYIIVTLQMNHDI